MSNGRKIKKAEREPKNHHDRATNILSKAKGLMGGPGKPSDNSEQQNPQEEGIFEGLAALGWASPIEKIYKEKAKKLNSALMAHYCAIGFLAISVCGGFFLDWDFPSTNRIEGIWKVFRHASIMVLGLIIVKLTKIHYQTLYRSKEECEKQVITACLLEKIKKLPEPTKSKIIEEAFAKLMSKLVDQEAGKQEDKNTNLLLNQCQLIVAELKKIKNLFK